MVGVQVSRSAFSQREVLSRGDTSGWTNTPTSSPALQAAALVQVRESEHCRRELRPKPRTKKSLVEQHVENMENSRLKAKSGECDNQGISI